MAIEVGVKKQAPVGEYRLIRVDDAHDEMDPLKEQLVGDYSDLKVLKEIAEHIHTSNIETDPNYLTLECYNDHGVKVCSWGLLGSYED